MRHCLSKCFIFYVWFYFIFDNFQIFLPDQSKSNQLVVIDLIQFEPYLKNVQIPPKPNCTLWIDLGNMFPQNWNISVIEYSYSCNVPSLFSLCCALVRTVYILQWLNFKFDFAKLNCSSLSKVLFLHLEVIFLVVLKTH